jgi:hypothetical protein
MKPRTPGFWLIAISLGIMPLKILGQSFWDAPGNGLLNALGGLPRSNPKWWEDKEHMQILRDTYEKQDRERRDAYEKQAREQRIILAEEDADAWVREHPETAEKPRRSSDASKPPHKGMPMHNCESDIATIPA